jgi:uncharacterized protein YecE (DUF72 family)
VPKTTRVTTEPSQEELARATALAERAPELARFGNVRTGTAGWTDRTLVKSGLFYPKGATSAEARLEHYAKHFSLVEVDATYYSLLPPAVAEHWAAWTPPDFRFDVKAHPVLTGHPIDVTRLPADLKQSLARAGFDKARVYPDRLPAELAAEIEIRFYALVEPLRAAGKLGCVMLQFPPWTTATRGAVRHLERVAERWSDVPLAVEFRNKSWLAPGRRERVFETLRRLRLSYVCVDEPAGAIGGVPPVVEVTRPELAVVRFHGQNAGAWRRGASVQERFNYLYSPGELEHWTQPVGRLAAEAAEVHAVFNNCVSNYAVLNAKDLAALLAGPVT